LRDQAATQVEQGKVKDLGAGGGEWEESDGDDKEDKLNCPEFVQGSSHQ
jgi:hypothetical protein